MLHARPKLRVYLDTSVLSAHFDERFPERRAATRRLWEHSGDLAMMTSTLALAEIAETRDPGLRTRLRALCDSLAVVQVTEDMGELAAEFVRAKIFGPSMWQDATHVAAAVLSQQDILLSWNFRHLVNRRRRAMIAELCMSLGLPTVEILAPAEL